MIEVRDLNFSYPGATKPAVRGIDFSVADGEIFGLLGPSGAGKSTTQKILIKLLQGWQGEVRVFGRDLTAWGQDYYERVGVSFELPNHYKKLTALENLRLFQALYHSPTVDPLELLALVGLEEAADPRVGEFSKGMQMRLNLVRALIHRPALLFMDEPTSGLDPVNARKVKQLVLQLKARGATILLTTHDMLVADELCDRVALIVDGAIKVIDSPRALKLQYGQPTVQVEYACLDGMHQASFALENLGSNREFMTLVRDPRWRRFTRRRRRWKMSLFR